MDWRFSARQIAPQKDTNTTVTISFEHPRIVFLFFTITFDSLRNYSFAIPRFYNLFYMFFSGYNNPRSDGFLYFRWREYNIFIERLSNNLIILFIIDQYLDKIHGSSNAKYFTSQRAEILRKILIMNSYSNIVIHIILWILLSFQFIQSRCIFKASNIHIFRFKRRVF